MPTTVVSPMHDAAAALRAPAPRLATLSNTRLALLDISKPGGSIFLDRLQHLLAERFGVASMLRATKTTYAKPARPDVLEALRGVDAVIAALAD